VTHTKIAFFGSSPCSGIVLERLCADPTAQGSTLCAVVTTLDKPIGRHLKLTPNPVKVLAQKHNIPTFGICLGNQILALAAGGDTYKLKYGHRSQNQPCTLVGTKRCYITTQNHGFAVNMKTLGNEWQEYFVNANDGTNEGIKHKTKPFMSVQFHPESFPGPNDTNFLFDEFIKLLK